MSDVLLTVALFVAAIASLAVPPWLGIRRIKRENACIMEPIIDYWTNPPWCGLCDMAHVGAPCPPIDERSNA